MIESNHVTINAATVADRERGSDHSLTPGQIRERLMAS
jgi:hypothetical protein